MEEIDYWIWTWNYPMALANSYVVLISYIAAQDVAVQFFAHA